MAVIHILGFTRLKCNIEYLNVKMHPVQNQKALQQSLFMIYKRWHWKNTGSLFINMTILWLVYIWFMPVAMWCNQHVLLLQRKTSTASSW